jgi:thioredoxin-like negative regulator of GroEL
MNRRVASQTSMPVRIAIILVLAWVSAATGADLEEAQRLFLSGNYTQCVALAETAANEKPDSEDWQLLLTDGLLALGRYAEAQAVVTNALDRGSPSVLLRWQAREVFLSNGQTGAAAAMV